MILKINKRNGEIIDLTNLGGSSTNRKGEYTETHKQIMFEEIIPLEEINSVTFGEIEIDINN